MKIKNLNFFYKKKHVLNNISFDIKPNSINLLIGPNGAGKSTLLNIIATNQSKSIHMDKNATISFLPQKIKSNIFVPITTNDILELDNKNANEHRLKILKLINLAEIKHTQISELSEGNRKKVFLAKVLLSEASYIILDEPTANLDVSSQKLFYEILNEIKKQENRSIIFSSNELHTIHSDVDQVLCLNKKMHHEHIIKPKESNNYSIYLHQH